MKRKIIKIDQELCNGCGACVNGCPEGAIQLIDGKARLVGELYCDGLGACIGNCPVNAITIEEREAAPYNEEKVMDNIVKQGPNTIKAHLHHLKHHGENGKLLEAKAYLQKHNLPIPADVTLAAACPNGSAEGMGCPGSRVVKLESKPSISKIRGPQIMLGGDELPSQLTNWPVQLKLAPLQAPYYENADLVIASDCVGFSLPNFHQKFLSGKTLLIGCPKLDDAQLYIEKLANIFHENAIKSIQVLIMEVPCCSGMRYIVDQALTVAERKGDIPVSFNVISIEGKILS